jgi:hypothetical protein
VRTLAARTVSPRTVSPRTVSPRAFAARRILSPPAIVGHAQVVDRAVLLADFAVADLFVPAARLVLVPALAATSGSPMGPMPFAGRMAPRSASRFPTALSSFAGPTPFAVAFASLGAATFPATGSWRAAFGTTWTTTSRTRLSGLLPASATGGTSVQEIGRLVAFAVVAVVRGLGQVLALVHAAVRARRAAATAAPAAPTAALASELVPAFRAGGACVQEVGCVLDVPFDRIARIGRLVPVAPGAAFSFAHMVSPFRRR